MYAWGIKPTARQEISEAVERYLKQDFSYFLKNHRYFFIDD
jgi:hypothetical protein